MFGRVIKLHGWRQANLAGRGHRQAGRGSQAGRRAGSAVGSALTNGQPGAQHQRRLAGKQGVQGCRVDRCLQLQQQQTREGRRSQGASDRPRKLRCPPAPIATHTQQLCASYATAAALVVHSPPAPHSGWRTSPSSRRRASREPASRVACCQSAAAAGVNASEALGRPRWQHSMSCGAAGWSGVCGGADGERWQEGMHAVDGRVGGRSGVRKHVTRAAHV